MKKYVILVLASAFMFNVVVTAQEQMSPDRSKGHNREFRGEQRGPVTPQMRADRMAKELSLTDAEKVKVKALFEAQDAKRIKQQDEIQKAKEELRLKLEAERKTQDAELEKIIGTEKFQKLQALRAERQEKMKQRMERDPKPELKDGE